MRADPCWAATTCAGTDCPMIWQGIPGRSTGRYWAGHDSVEEGVGSVHCFHCCWAVDDFGPSPYRTRFLVSSRQQRCSFSVAVSVKVRLLHKLSFETLGAVDFESHRQASVEVPKPKDLVKPYSKVYACWPTTRNTAWKHLSDSFHTFFFS